MVSVSFYDIDVKYVDAVSTPCHAAGVSAEHALPTLLQDPDRVSQAATNHQIHKTHNARGRREESIDIRWRQLQSHLGHEPARTPPRT